MPALPAILAFAYLIGSIPSGVLIARVAGTADPRTIGSGNIGATNVLRSGRKDLAAFTLLADALKGTIPVLVAIALARLLAARGVVSPLPLGAVAACGAFLGHCFPLYLRFRGGKGVATFLGCLIALAWPAALAFAAAWLAVAFLTRYSSAAAFAGSAAAPLALLLLHRPEAAALFAGLAGVLWLKHAANIGRLIAGTEPKIGRGRGVVAAGSGSGAA